MFPLCILFNAIIIYMQHLVLNRINYKLDENVSHLVNN